MVILLLAAALHAGFQLVVTTVVYPALAELPPDRWASAHRSHSNRIAVLVVPLYLLLAAACLHALRHAPGPDVYLAVAAEAVAVGVTALAAAPTHTVLARTGADPRVIRRLLVVDRIRCAAAVLGLVAASVATL